MNKKKRVECVCAQHDEFKIMYDDHNGPVSALSINYSPEYEFLNGLILTASYDWTVKLWNPTNNK